MKYDRLYVIVRKDLKCSSPAVQAGHVVSKFCIESPWSRKWDNRYLIYLGVENVNELKKLYNEFCSRNIDVTWFMEPDCVNVNDDIFTGFCGLIDKEDANFLSRLELLS